MDIRSRESGFTPAECDHFINYMSDLQAGRTSVEGFAPRAADAWSRLIHRGGPILEDGSFRHSWAGHYIPQSFNPWPYEDKPRLRVSFDGVSRFTPTH
jgi:hypothetical protein